MKKVRFLIGCVILSIVSITYANVIEIHSNITTNQIWTANNTYHVTAGVNVTALLVIEPGTNIKFSSGGGLIVKNGGTLISAGTPNNKINYTSDANSGWGDYNCAIEIQETASPATKIIYNRIGYASIAILTKNIQLDTPIQNSFLFYNYYGILEYGTHHTDIINNLIYHGYNDDYYSYSIDIYMESEEGEADANSSILIENNTCDYQDYGIRVHGTANINNMGRAKLINNIVCESAEYGIGIVDGYMDETVCNTGYYDNSINQYGYNVARESNTVETTVYPFDAAEWHLIGGCPFINAGKEYIEETGLIGTTTNVDGTPDSNKIDIGFHYSNWNYSNAGTTTLRADFDNNYKVDYKDLRFFANFWLFDYNEAYQIWLWDYDNSGKVDMPDLRVVSEYWLSAFDFYDFADFANQWQKKVDTRYNDKSADLNKDGRVNFKDFAMLANEWKKRGDAEPNIQINLYGDGSNGYVEVGISGYTQYTSQAFLLVDGQYLEGLFGFEDGESELVNVAALGPGPHQFKVVSMDSNSIICSHIKEASFNSPLSYCSYQEAYEVNKPLYFCAYVPDNEDVCVRAKDCEGNILWTQTYTGGNVNSYIPAEITGSHKIGQIILEKNPAGGMLLMDGGGSSSSVALSVTQLFDPKRISPNVRALIVAPDLIVNSFNQEVRAAVRNTFVAHDVEYWELESTQATPANVAWFAQNRNIQYLYFYGHGDYRSPAGERALRTNITLWNGPCFSFKQSDYPPGNIPSWCKRLGSHYDHTGWSIKAMGFHTLKFAHLNCCYSGRLMFNGNKTALIEGTDEVTGLALNAPNDMTQALGIGLNDESLSLYLGWYDACSYTTRSTFNKFNIDEWGELRDGAKVYNAIKYAYYESEWDPPSGRFPFEDLRLFGQGIYYYLYGIE